MNEELIIEKFGPIEKITINLKRVNVIIGNQSTGKSTIAKLIKIFKSLDFLTCKNTSERLKLFENFGLQYHFLDDTFLSYKALDYQIIFRSSKFTIKLSARLKPLINTHKSLTDLLGKNPERLSDLFSQRSEVSNLINRIKKDAIYFPTERMLVSSFPSIASLKGERSFLLPEYLINFRVEFENCRNQNTSLKIDFLDIEFKYNKTLKSDFIEIGNKQIPLQQAASGLQSLIPLYVVLEKSSASDALEGIFLIEEPETNLFPVTQFELIKYITSKCLKFNDSFLLTTHSPYILTSLNNLMYAYNVGQNSKKKVSKIVEEKYWINPKDVSAYLLKYDEEKGGIIEESILDSEGLIQVQKIDSISGVLNAEFDKLMNVELNLT